MATLLIENVQSEFLPVFEALAKVAKATFKFEGEQPTKETLEALQNPKIIGTFKNFDEYLRNLG